MTQPEQFISDDNLNHENDESKNNICNDFAQPEYDCTELSYSEPNYDQVSSDAAQVQLGVGQQIVANPAGEDFSQPPLPPEANVETPNSQEETAQAMSITIEEDHKIYVAPKRKTLCLTDGLLADLKTALKQSEITVVDVQCLRRK